MPLVRVVAIVGPRLHPRLEPGRRLLLLRQVCLGLPRGDPRSAHGRLVPRATSATHRLVTRVLTERELNRALLARQLLLERAKTPLPRALERIGGIQAQYAPSMYVGLWARLEGFERDQLTRALQRNDGRPGHADADDDPPRLAGATTGPSSSGSASAARAMAQAHKADKRKIEAACRKLRAHFDGRADPAELNEILSADSATRNGVGLFLDLVGCRRRERGSGGAPMSTRSQRIGSGPEDATEAQGLEHLVRRYLTGFGPARPDEIASWAGVSKPDVSEALEGIELQTLRGRAGQGARRPPAPPAARRRHARTGPLPPGVGCDAPRPRPADSDPPEKYRSRVFNTRTPTPSNTFLVDGQVAGTWKYEGRGEGQAVRQAAEGRAVARSTPRPERLAAFHS